jgi:hypothetical protein
LLRARKAALTITTQRAAGAIGAVQAWSPHNLVSKPLQSPTGHVKLDFVPDKVVFQCPHFSRDILLGRYTRAAYVYSK